MRLATHEKVTVIPEWGNHGRINLRGDAVPFVDNFDRMCYELAMATSVGREEARLETTALPEDIQRIEIGNYKALPHTWR
jgi:hypothetical protein